MVDCFRVSTITAPAEEHGISWLTFGKGVSPSPSLATEVGRKEETWNILIAQLLL